MAFSLSTPRRAALAVVGLSSALVLTACGGSTAPAAPTGFATSASPAVGSAASGPHNSADIAFATDMIPHHTQAVTMAELALRTSTQPQVVALATAITGAQGPEITTMTGWLRGWAAPAASGGAALPGMPGMPGMMSEAQMQALSAATGTGFDRRWITMMTAHHTGAIAMARTELASGANPDAKRLAGQIIADQTAELTTMASLAATLS